MPDELNSSCGRIERLNIATGKAQEVYRSCDACKLCEHNDLALIVKVAFI